MLAIDRCRTAWASLGVVLGLVSPSLAQVGGDVPDARGPEVRAASTRLVLEGTVLEQDGRAAVGAMVVASAGGEAVTDASGHYVLDLDVPMDAESLEVTAAGRRGTNLVASRRIDLSTTSGHAELDPLRLAQGLTCIPRWLPTFGGEPGPGGDVKVEALAVFDAGDGPQLHIGGDFSSLGGAPAWGIARWDGSRWLSVGTGFTGFVRALLVFDDGNGPALYAGGSVDLFGGGTRMAKWDGSSWSDADAGLDGTVEALAVFDDGGGPALYAGGDFTGKIAKWNGTSWSTVGSGIVTGTVLALTVLDDGSGEALYVGGNFFFAGGVSARRVARWDGTSWSGLANGLNDDVEALAAFDDGGGTKLYVGGNFTMASGTPASRIARWDGASWSALGAGTNGTVLGLTVFDDGNGPRLCATGSFLAAGTVAASRLARWNGTSWSAVPFGLDHVGLVLAALDDGGGPALFVGGIFNFAGPGIGANRVAKWDGASWSAFDDGLSYAVVCQSVHDDGNGPALYAGGEFLSAGGEPATRIARWDGADWSALGSGISGSNSFDRYPSVLVSHDDGSGPALYVGGSFTIAGGVTRNRIARWNGSSWSGLGTGMNGAVSALVVYDDGGGSALYAGGGFTTAGGVPASCVARWNGSSWSALGSGMNGAVLAFAPHDDGGGPALYAGGFFTTAGGVAANRVARWNGSSWSAVGGGIDGISGVRVEALEVFDDGNGSALYAAGHFTLAAGDAANHIARWDGTNWSSLGSGLNTLVESLKAFDDGNGPALYAGGLFTVAGGLAVNRIARWDGSSWSPLDGGASSTVLSLEVFDDGGGPALHVGSYGHMYDSGDSYLAKWGCLDTEAPTILHPTLVGAIDRLGTPPGEIVTFVVTATDDQDPSPDVVCVPPSGSLLPPGTTLVDCTATDASGNESTAQFPVVVRSNVDQRKP